MKPASSQQFRESPAELPTELLCGLDARFCEVMDAAPVMIWVSGKDKGCFWFNRPWLTFTGRCMAQEVGSGWSEGVHHDDIERCLRIYVNHFEARTNFRMQYRLRRHDGTYRWLDDTGIPRFAPDGDFLGYIGSCIDIHEHRQTQSELRRRALEISELNRRADAAILAAAIAHEVRQPLTGMVAVANAGVRWLAGETPDVGKAMAGLSKIVRMGHRASEIIESVQALTKKEHRVPVPVNLNEIIRDVLAIVEDKLQTNHVAVQTSFKEKLPDVIGDQIQLQQAILNLIRNAVEAMGSVPESARILHLKTEFEDSQHILITVQDSGPGIDSKDAERIFERFFTTKPQGMGMGLAICRSIIEAHDGRLWAETGAHQGALFRISLPIESHTRELVRAARRAIGQLVDVSYGSIPAE
jgi:PAS domain S-box-containing protein